MGLRNVSLFGARAELGVSPAYSFAFDFEYWDTEPSVNIITKQWWLFPVLASVYIPLMVGAQRLVRRPLEVRSLLIAWNSLLGLFSIAGAARMLPELVYVVTRHGFRYSICDNSYSEEAVTAVWTVLFGWSKLVEFADTAFLVAKKRRLSTLHLWHHASVAVFTWHACVHKVAAGRWFVTMNYAMHGIMYSYFAVQALGHFKIPRRISLAVTTLQITQMIAGVGITCRIWWEKLFSSENCHHPIENIYFCFLIYGSYMVLFIRFFVNAYVTKKDSKDKSQ